MSTPRIRITVTLPRDLVQRIERQASRQRASRSRIVEAWLRSGARSHGSSSLDAEIERYYVAASQQDRSEDDALAVASRRRAARLKVDDE